MIIILVETIICVITLTASVVMLFDLIKDIRRDNNKNKVSFQISVTHKKYGEE